MPRLILLVDLAIGSFIVWVIWKIVNKIKNGDCNGKK